MKNKYGVPFRGYRFSDDGIAARQAAADNLSRIEAAGIAKGLSRIEIKATDDYWYALSAYEQQIGKEFMKHKVATAIHVWDDAPAAVDNGVTKYYSISEVDESGDEIRCIGGDEDRAEAWAEGCARAQELEVECIEMDKSGRITDTYRKDSQ